MRSIGIIGGVGPYAGLDLNRKIFQLARGIRSDQDYPAVFLLSLPQIPDRSMYLLNPDTAEQPVSSIVAAFSMLEQLGCTACGIPCNTAHAAPILNEVRTATNQYRMQFVHMVRETVRNLGKCHAGLLATMGTYTGGVYEEEAAATSGTIIVPETVERRQRVHDGVYSQEFGIKAFSDPIQPAAIQLLQSEGNALIERGAEIIILGCTEISLCEPFLHFAVPVIDPLQVLAHSLLQIVFPEKL